MKPKLIRISSILAIALCLSAFAAAQELPKKIRGYKVHDLVIRVGGEVSTPTKVSNVDAALKIGDVTIADFGLTGITIEATASVTAFDQTGRVDFLTFRDFRVNGVAVEIEEFKHTFSFKRGKQMPLPAPARVLIRGTGIAMTAIKELIGSKSEWTITGQALIFGKFKKFGLSFKRVIPAQIELKIPNPIKSLSRNEN